MNLCIVDKKPNHFEELRLENDKIIVGENIEINKDEVYACLYFEGLKNITFIVNNSRPYCATLLLKETDKYQKILKSLQEKYKSVLFSQQDKKINGYAGAIVDKLREGIETGIVDAVVEVNIKCCPVCGMECDPNIPYCMECGAEV